MCSTPTQINSELLRRALQCGTQKVRKATALPVGEMDRLTCLSLGFAAASINKRSGKIRMTELFASNPTEIADSTKKANRERLAYIGSMPGTSKSSSRDADNWFTPIIYTNMAREVMGDIDLDPFSSATANESIKSKRYFDPDTDAFKQRWFQDQGRVFMNPPYGRGLVESAVDLFLDNWKNESVSQGVVLVNNATETRWFQSLLRSGAAVCFPDRRIAFSNDDGKHISSNTRGQAFFYFGHRMLRFSDVFGRIGIVLERANSK